MKFTYVTSKHTRASLSPTVLIRIFYNFLFEVDFPKISFKSTFPSETLKVIEMFSLLIASFSSYFHNYLTHTIHPPFPGLLGKTPHLKRVERKSHFSCHAGHTALDAPQVTFALLGHVVLLVSQHLQILLSRAALNPFSSQPVSELGRTFLLLSRVPGSSPFQQPHCSSGRTVIITPFLPNMQ